ncbi:MAG: hypothetical protein M1813_003623 [Trichoglossum hirsutum]|nr:MAG: hypothetical protein M1813_003623 [Trichoglossum hirsutum]
MSFFSRLRIGEPKASREKNGLWELLPKEPDTEGCVDIVAVHGLGGDAYGTWTHENGKLWLRDFLASQIPEARILTYGYDSVVAFSKSSAEVDDFARDLLQRVNVTRKPTSEKARPLFFICHSLGGILFRQALNLAHLDAKNFRELLEKFARVIFMGTPHGGSDVAFDVLRWPAFAHGNSTPSIKDSILSLPVPITS